MALSMITFTKLALPALALTASVFAMTDSGRAHDAKALSSIDLYCAVTISNGRYGLEYRGEITANRSVDGQFTIDFKSTGRNSSSIRQSGRFSLESGQSTTLGKASFGGNADVSVELTLNWDGQKMICNTDQPVDL